MPRLTRVEINPGHAPHTAFPGAARSHDTRVYFLAGVLTNNSQSGHKVFVCLHLPLTS